MMSQCICTSARGIVLEQELLEEQTSKFIIFCSVRAFERGARAFGMRSENYCNEEQELLE